MLGKNTLRIILSISLAILIILVCAFTVSRSDMQAIRNGLAFQSDEDVSSTELSADELDLEEYVYHFEEEEKKDEEDVWHGDIEQVSDFTGEIPRIICWGDSLTQSYDNRSAYPDVLREISGCDVINYGIQSELTYDIALRAGGIGVYTEDFTIPVGTGRVPVGLYTQSGSSVRLLREGEAGINPCFINNVCGRLSVEDGIFYFARLEAGDEVTVADGTPLVTQGMANRRPTDVAVIFTGTNDKPDAESVANVISTQAKIINAIGTDKYVVIGLTYRGGMDEIDEVNAALAEEYGDRFIDIRKYLLEYGLEDAGITPTDKDIADIANGEIPSSLRRDYVHGNESYYKLLARQVFRKIIQLGYLPKDTQYPLTIVTRSEPVTSYDAAED